MTLADEMIIEKRIEHELGVKEGITQGKIETAKNMKLKNYSVNDIIDITGLTKEEIEKL